ENERACRDFLRENRPDLFARAPKDWAEDVRQWYLRNLHPFRISEVLRNDEWRRLFDHCPDKIVPQRCILAVCRAHGQKPEELRVNRDLEYLPASDVDPRFCAILLRLADLLDFDDTRAPRVLYHYAECNDKSRGEWDKHCASAGFRYPPSPSANELPYRARCKNPAIEHAVRDFLDWVDDELGNAVRLKGYCQAGWRQQFPFPRAVLRREIESDGYMSGDFCLTMDQEQILNLLMGENLYDSQDVFVRELLQNAIDAVLLRGEMDPSFHPEESRIDFWEWNDREGNFWFRIDDEGTGMTQGMLQRYFLKVGKSYYTSKELEQDLRGCGQTENYQGISRFGIGFLSCFLCGDYAEVSTLYCAPNKNIREDPEAGASLMTGYGLHLQVTGLTGYYTLKSQAREHEADNLPKPDFYDAKGRGRAAEWHGYRANAGTSIVLRLNPGKLGPLNLRNTVEKYLCGARVPVYYNNKRVGKTYAEAMQAVHEVAGKKLYELPLEIKREFDQCFPRARGQYPKIEATVIPLDTEEDQVLPGLSGVVMKYRVKFEQTPRWRVKDLEYEMDGDIAYSFFKNMGIQLSSQRVKNEEAATGNEEEKKKIQWPDLEKKYGITATKRLSEKLDSLKTCPKTVWQLGEAWIPFWGDDVGLSEVWEAYYDDCNQREMFFNALQCKCPNVYMMFSNVQLATTAVIAYAHKGMFLENSGEYLFSCLRKYNVLFLLDGDCKPDVKISRSGALTFPLKVLLAIAGISNKYEIREGIKKENYRSKEWRNATLQEWREIRKSSLGRWMKQNQGDYFEKRKNLLLKYSGVTINGKICIPEMGRIHECSILDKYLMAELQDDYRMTIKFEKRQTITLHERKEAEYEKAFDIFPPMMFCEAANERSRKYLCHAEASDRKGITSDHPFI
ncbi:MAG: ATP-binding protein, partial [Lachnospiraceae bacterium]|nr:ATP-binding protein [Lachnospiraceae bacterium]